MKYQNVDKINKNVGMRIKLERVKRNWTQDILAEKSDISRLTISKIERGTGSPTLESLIRIANGLDMKLTDILDDSTLTM